MMGKERRRWGENWMSRERGSVSEMGAVSKAPSTGRSSGTWTGGLRHRPHWVTLVVTFLEWPHSDLHTLLGTAQVLLCLLLMKILPGRPLCPFHWGGRRGAEALRGAPGHTAAWGGARPERGGESLSSSHCAQVSGMCEGEGALARVERPGASCTQDRSEAM